MVYARIFGLLIAITIILLGNECSTIPESLQDFQVKVLLFKSKEVSLIILDVHTICIPFSLFVVTFQTVYYLPYSKSEDVDFSLFRPEGFGCFKWSVEDKVADRVRLETHTTDKKLSCGNRVLMQVLAATSEEKKLDFILTGENVETKAKHNKDTNTDMKLAAGTWLNFFSHIWINLMYNNTFVIK